MSQLHPPRLTVMARGEAGLQGLEVAKKCRVCEKGRHVESASYAVRAARPNASMMIAVALTFLLFCF